MNRKWYEGKTALITGASSGLGLAFAEALAERGTHLMLVARGTETLRALAARLSKVNAVEVEVLDADLSQAGAVQQVATRVIQMRWHIDILINHVGFGTQGRFETLSPEHGRQQVLLNVLAAVDLIHAFLPAMLSRGRGIVINAASTAAFQPVPSIAASGGTKAFLLSLSRALWTEDRQRGVHVLALCPGARDTAFFETLGPSAIACSPKSTPEVVVAKALRTLEQGQEQRRAWYR